MRFVLNFDVEVIIINLARIRTDVADAVQLAETDKYRKIIMPKLAANLTMMFNEVDFLDRFAAAAKAGFKGVEYLFPYDYDKSVLKQNLAEHKLTQVLHNLPAGNWAAGERGIVCHADRVA